MSKVRVLWIVGPKIQSVGTFKAAAICIGPESLAMMRSQFEINADICVKLDFGANKQSLPKFC